MKRLLSFVMALSILFSLVPSAVAEGTGEHVPCTRNPACILGDGHAEAECSVPQPKVCKTGCTLESGHTGECSVPQPKVCETGCTLEPGHTGDCVVPEAKTCETGDAPVEDKVLYALIDDEYVTEITVDWGVPPRNIQFYYFGEGDARDILDNTAVFQVTDLNGMLSTGITMEKMTEYPSLYTISFLSAGPYQLMCTLNGENIGTIRVNVNSGYTEVDQAPMGLSMKIGAAYSTGKNVFVGQSEVLELYYNGEEITDSSAPFIYDKDAISLVKLNWGWEFVALVPGEHTIDYADNQYSSITISAEQSGGVNVDNPPVDLHGLYFCWMENNQRKWDNNITVSDSFSGTLVLVKNGVATIVTDGGRLSYSPEQGLNSRFYSDGTLEIQPNGKAGLYTVTYTDTDNTPYSLQISYGMNVDNPPPNIGPGLYLCWNQNGQTIWSNSTTISGQFYATLVLVQMIDGQKVASRVTSGSNLSVSPAGGISYTVYSDGNIQLSGVTGGTYKLIYTVNENTKYELSVRYDDGNVDLADAPTIPGLYHVIYDNKYFFTGNKNISVNNGTGRIYGPLVWVDDKGTPKQLTDPALLDTSSKPYLTVNPSNGMVLSYDSSKRSWVMDITKADLYTITYVDQNNKTYSVTMRISNSGPLYASVDGGQNWMGTLYVTEDEPVEVEFAWKNSAGRYVKTLGNVHGSNDQVHITRNMNTGISTVVVDNPNVNANATYQYDDYNTYMMKIIVQEAHRLALVKQGSQTPVYDYIGEVNSTVPVKFLFGQPSSGLKDLPVKPSVSQGLSLEAKEGTDLYELKILTEGKHTVSFTHTCTDTCPDGCTASGKTYAVNIEGIPAGTGGSLFALSGNSSSPVFVTEMLAGETMRLRMCYGTFGNYTILTADKLNVEGDAVTIRQSGDAIELVYNSNGQALIQYVDGDKITHNYAVKCYTGMEELGMAHNSEQGYNTVNLKSNGKIITVGPALRNDEEMWMWPGNSFNHTAEEDWDIHDEVVIGAMYAGEGNSVTGPADKKFFDRISNINMRIMHCNNTVTNPNGGYNVAIETPTTVEWNGLTLQMQKFQGTKGLYFEAGLMISYDVDMGKDGTYRFYSPAGLSYRALPSDSIKVNIEDADVLNTLLSNGYALINYLEAENPGFTYGGGDLILQLPAVTYDKVLVSQLMLPGSSDVLGNFIIQGTEKDGKRTTVPGIYSKGFLHGVDNISFVADPDVKMTFDGEEFTCGLLVNNTRNTIQPTFHKKTLELYHPEFMGLIGKDLDAKFANYQPSVSTNGNSYNIGRITNCSFDGFEYAMRTDKGGFVQGAHGCTISRCKYGVYINAGGVQTLHTDGRANTIWKNNTFIENWAAVRITGLPKDLSPYYIRFIDNNFYRNNKEFWVTAKGHYYFYRNYYEGHWNDDYRQDFWKDENGNSGKALRMLSDGAEDVARPAILDAGEDTVLVTNPCRSVPGSNENLWIFDAENQNTVILQSEADGLKVSADAISALGEKLDIPVLNEKEKSVGIWTIYEGGDNQ